VIGDRRSGRDRRATVSEETDALYNRAIYAEAVAELYKRRARDNRRGMIDAVTTGATVLRDVEREARLWRTAFLGAVLVFTAVTAAGMLL